MVLTATGTTGAEGRYRNNGTTGVKGDAGTKWHWRIKWCCWSQRRYWTNGIDGWYYWSEGGTEQTVLTATGANPMRRDTGSNGIDGITVPLAKGDTEQMVLTVQTGTTGAKGETGKRYWRQTVPLEQKKETWIKWYWRANGDYWNKWRYWNKRCYWSKKEILEQMRRWTNGAGVKEHTDQMVLTVQLVLQERRRTGTNGDHWSKKGDTGMVTE
jgi:hypothetical protein